MGSAPLERFSRQRIQVNLELELELGIEHLEQLS